MTPDQEIRMAALKMAADEVYGSTSAESLVAYARVLEDYLRGPQPVRVTDFDDFYCAGAVSGGTDARRGCSHPRHSHGKYGCEVGTASMNTPLCPCEREDGK